MTNGRRAPSEGGGRPLDNKGNSFTPPPPFAQVKGDFRRIRRDTNDELKRIQRRVTVLRAAALCMFGRVDGPHVQIDVGASRIAHVSGVHRCGSPWACPLCAPVVRQQRALEIDQALAEALSRGWGGLFVTSTLRHARGDSLASRLDVVSEMGRNVRKGAPWDRRRDRLGFRGVIQTTEVTWGNSAGWHPHSHAVWLFERPPSDDEVADFSAWHFGRLSTIATRKNLGSLDHRAFDVRRITEPGALSQYLVKIEDGWTPGMELARGDVKRGRSGRLTPFELLGWLATTGEVVPYRLWQEFERATKGKHAVRFSPGLRRDLLGDEDGATDEELAAAEGLDLTLLRCLVENADWNRLVATGRRGAFLSEVEDVASTLMLMADLLGIVIQPIDSIQEAVKA